MILDPTILATLPIPAYVAAWAASKPQPRQSRTRRSYVPAAQPIQFQPPKKPQQQKKDRNRPLSPTPPRNRPGRKPYFMPRHLRNLGSGLDVRVAEIKRRHGSIKPDRAAFEATREAIQELLPRPQRGGFDVTPAQEDEIIDRAISLCSLIQGETETDRRLAEADTGRHDQYRCILRRLFKTYDPAKARDIHPTEADYIDADSSLTGEVSNAAIDEMRAKVRRNVGSMSCETMRNALAVTYVNGTVDAITEGGVGPVRWFTRSFCAA